MPWRYQQSTGDLTSPSGNKLAQGWAGHGAGRNNPAWSDVPNVGPLPQGQYTIQEPIDSPHTGPYSLPLVPDPNNNMYNRAFFRIHGAALQNPEMSSDGCIILPRPIRQIIWQSGDTALEVVA
jgi:Protein of unknown function (DUF2778)